jgi:hypothetical protein
VCVCVCVCVCGVFSNCWCVTVITTGGHDRNVRQCPPHPVRGRTPVSSLGVRGASLHTRSAPRPVLPDRPGTAGPLRLPQSNNLTFWWTQVREFMGYHNALRCQSTNCPGVNFLPTERLVFHQEHNIYGHLVILENGPHSFRWLVFVSPVNTEKRQAFMPCGPRSTSVERTSAHGPAATT